MPGCMVPSLHESLRQKTVERAAGPDPQGARSVTAAMKVAPQVVDSRSSHSRARVAMASVRKGPATSVDGPRVMALPGVRGVNIP